MWSHGILAAVDTSVSAEHVAKVAANIAVECALPLIFISVLVEDLEEPRTEIERTLAHALAIATDIGATASTEVLIGKPFEQILEVAKSRNADLIVMGRHGESNVIKMPFGGTTEKVVGHSDMPVLVVHPQPPIDPEL